MIAMVKVVVEYQGYCKKLFPHSLISFYFWMAETGKENGLGIESGGHLNHQYKHLSVLYMLCLGLLYTNPVKCLLQ
jgi:hypothetical protein